MTTRATPGDSWPVWTNGPIVLFHGTILASAENIRVKGVDLSTCRQNTDFGQGFYTTTRRENAVLLAENRSLKSGGSPRIVRIALDREKLARLTTIAFVQGDLNAVDFWSFVAGCRQGMSHSPLAGIQYDVAYGPVARTWWGPANSTLWEGYDQISFHTEAAVALLNTDAVCSVETI